MSVREILDWTLYVERATKTVSGTISWDGDRDWITKEQIS